jgi:pimeloyl-ACP methyl ester carboxylesterase
VSPTWATLAGGLRIHYRVQGPPGAPWLVLVNGLLSDTTMWAGAARDLGRDHRVLTFDSRGQGRSDAPGDGPYPTALLAADAWELLDLLDIRRPWLAGLSNGSNIALELLAAHPGAFAGAVLTSAVPRTDFPMALRLRHWLRCLELGGPGLQFDAAAPYLWGDAFLEQRHRVLRAYFVKQKYPNEPFHGSRHQIEGVLHWDIRPRLAAIREPVLLLAGAEDLLTPVWKCLETAKLITHSRFEVVPGVGHAFPVEKPAEYAQRVREFTKY